MSIFSSFFFAKKKMLQFVKQHLIFYEFYFILKKKHLGLYLVGAKVKNVREMDCIHFFSENSKLNGDHIGSLTLCFMLS